MVLEKDIDRKERIVDEMGNDHTDDVQLGKKALITVKNSLKSGFSGFDYKMSEAMRESNEEYVFKIQENINATEEEKRRAKQLEKKSQELAVREVNASMTMKQVSEEYQKEVVNKTKNPFFYNLVYSMGEQISNPITLGMDILSGKMASFISGGIKLAKPVLGAVAEIGIGALGNVPANIHQESTKKKILTGEDLTFDEMVEETKMTFFTSVLFNLGGKLTRHIFDSGKFGVSMDVDGNVKVKDSPQMNRAIKQLEVKKGRKLDIGDIKELTDGFVSEVEKDINLEFKHNIDEGKFSFNNMLTAKNFTGKDIKNIAESEIKNNINKVGIPKNTDVLEANLNYKKNGFDKPIQTNLIEVETDTGKFYLNDEMYASVRDKVDFSEQTIKIKSKDLPTTLDINDTNTITRITNGDPLVEPLTPKDIDAVKTIKSVNRYIGENIDNKKINSLSDLENYAKRVENKVDTYNTIEKKVLANQETNKKYAQFMGRVNELKKQGFSEDKIKMYKQGYVVALSSELDNVSGSSKAMVDIASQMLESDKTILSSIKNQHGNYIGEAIDPRKSNIVINSIYENSGADIPYIVNEVALRLGDEGIFKTSDGNYVGYKLGNEISLIHHLEDGTTDGITIKPNSKGEMIAVPLSKSARDRALEKHSKFQFKQELVEKATDITQEEISKENRLLFDNSTYKARVYQLKTSLDSLFRSKQSKIDKGLADNLKIIFPEEFSDSLEPRSFLSQHTSDLMDKWFDKKLPLDQQKAISNIFELTEIVKDPTIKFEYSLNGNAYNGELTPMQGYILVDKAIKGDTTELMFSSGENFTAREVLIDGYKTYKQAPLHERVSAIIELYDTSLKELGLTYEDLLDKDLFKEKVGKSIAKKIVNGEEDFFNRGVKSLPQGDTETIGYVLAKEAGISPSELKKLVSSELDGKIGVDEILDAKRVNLRNILLNKNGIKGGMTYNSIVGFMESLDDNLKTITIDVDGVSKEIDLYNMLDTIKSRGVEGSKKQIKFTPEEKEIFKNLTDDIENKTKIKNSSFIEYNRNINKELKEIFSSLKDKKELTEGQSELLENLLSDKESVKSLSKVLFGNDGATVSKEDILNVFTKDIPEQGLVVSGKKLKGNDINKVIKWLDKSGFDSKDLKNIYTKYNDIKGKLITQDLFNGNVTKKSGSFNISKNVINEDFKNAEMLAQLINKKKFTTHMNALTFGTNSLDDAQIEFIVRAYKNSNDPLFKSEDGDINSVVRRVLKMAFGDDEELIEEQAKLVINRLDKNYKELSELFGEIDKSKLYLKMAEVSSQLRSSTNPQKIGLKYKYTDNYQSLPEIIYDNFDSDKLYKYLSSGENNFDKIGSCLYSQGEMFNKVTSNIEIKAEKEVCGGVTLDKVINELKENQSELQRHTANYNKKLNEAVTSTRKTNYTPEEIDKSISDWTKSIKDDFKNNLDKKIDDVFKEKSIDKFEVKDKDGNIIKTYNKEDMVNDIYNSVFGDGDIYITPDEMKGILNVSSDEATKLSNSIGDRLNKKVNQFINTNDIPKELNPKEIASSVLSSTKEQLSKNIGGRLDGYKYTPTTKLPQVLEMLRSTKVQPSNIPLALKNFTGYVFNTILGYSGVGEIVVKPFTKFAMGVNEGGLGTAIFNFPKDIYRGTSVVLRRWFTTSLQGTSMLGYDGTKMMAKGVLKTSSFLNKTISGDEWSGIGKHIKKWKANLDSIDKVVNKKFGTQAVSRATKGLSDEARYGLDVTYKIAYEQSGNKSAINTNFGSNSQRYIEGYVQKDAIKSTIKFANKTNYSDLTPKQKIILDNSFVGMGLSDSQKLELFNGSMDKIIKAYSENGKFKYDDEMLGKIFFDYGSDKLQNKLLSYGINMEDIPLMKQSVELSMNNYINFSADAIRGTNSVSAGPIPFWSTFASTLKDFYRTTGYMYENESLGGFASWVGTGLGTGVLVYYNSNLQQIAKGIISRDPRKTEQARRNMVPTTETIKNIPINIIQLYGEQVFSLGDVKTSTQGVSDLVGRIVKKGVDYAIAKRWISFENALKLTDKLKPEDEFSQPRFFDDKGFGGACLEIGSRFGAGVISDSCTFIIDKVNGYNPTREKENFYQKELNLKSGIVSSTGRTIQEDAEVFIQDLFSNMKDSFNNNTIEEANADIIRNYISDFPKDGIERGKLYIYNRMEEDGISINDEVRAELENQAIAKATTIHYLKNDGVFNEEEYEKDLKDSYEDTIAKSFEIGINALVASNAKKTSDDINTLQELIAIGSLDKDRVLNGIDKEEFTETVERAKKKLKEDGIYDTVINTIEQNPYTPSTELELYKIGTLGGTFVDKDGKFNYDEYLNTTLGEYRDMIYGDQTVDVINVAQFNAQYIQLSNDMEIEAKPISSDLIKQMILRNITAEDLVKTKKAFSDEMQNNKRLIESAIHYDENMGKYETVVDKIESDWVNKVDSYLEYGYIPEGDNVSDEFIKNFDSLKFTKDERKNNNVKQLLIKVLPICKEVGIDPIILLSQYVWETGWGTNKIVGKNNIFNIKYTPNYKGGYTEGLVREQDKDGNDYHSYEKFRNYDTLEDAIRDYARLIKKLYTDENGKIDLNKLKKYGTDKNYVQNIMGTYNKFIVKLQEKDLLNGMKMYANAKKIDPKAKGFVPSTDSIEQNNLDGIVAMGDSNGDGEYSSGSWLNYSPKSPFHIDRSGFMTLANNVGMKLGGNGNWLMQQFS